MVNIEDLSAKQPLPEPSRDDDRQRTDAKAPDADQCAGRQSRLLETFAKAAKAAGMRMVTGTGKGDRTRPQLDDASDSGQDSGAGATSQREIYTGDLVQNLKAIVADDSRWALFAMGALGLQSSAEACISLRESLTQGIEKNSLEGLANLANLLAQPGEGLSAGRIERTMLWLSFPRYFENLFKAVREKSLPQDVSLYTSDLLIKFLGTIKE